MIVWDHGRLRYAEVWFDEPVPTAGADILFLRQRPVREGNGHWEEKHSLEVDLQQPLEAVFQSFKKDTRNEIRRSERDGVTYEAVTPEPSHRSLQEFADYFDRFAMEKALGTLDREYLSACAASGVLVLSRAVSPEGDVLVWHSHLWVYGRSRLLHSASLSREEAGPTFRNLVGRANRMAHWHDIQRAASAGLTHYDFGGWYAGETDEHLLRINRFKEEFGGRRVVQYNGIRALSVRGQAALRLRAVARRVRRLLG